MNIQTAERSDRSVGVGGPNSDDEAIVVVLAADENFALPLSVALYSIVRHFDSSRTLRLCVIDAGISDATKARLRRVVQEGSKNSEVAFEWLDPDPSELGIIDRELNRRYNESMFYRLLIPELLADEAKAIYLDSDIVLHDNIANLWNEPFLGTAARAVQERTVSCPVAGVAEWKGLGMEPDAPFFNSGVMIMDLDAWRAQGIHKETIAYLANPENRLIRVGDQEALNAVLYDKWTRLEPGWNALFYFPDAVVAEAHLSHFADAHPWRANWRHPAAPAFVQNLRQSGWFTAAGFLAWALRLRAKRGLRFVKAATRPLRHRLGIRMRRT